MDGWYLDTPWTDLINTKLSGSGQAHAHTGTHQDFPLYNIKLHNRQKELTETPVSRAGGRRRSCLDLFRMAMNKAFGSTVTFYLLIVVVLTQGCSFCRNSSSRTLKCALFCAFGYKENFAQIQVNKLTAGVGGGAGRDWEFGTGRCKGLYTVWRNTELY